MLTSLQGIALALCASTLQPACAAPPTRQEAETTPAAPTQPVLFIRAARLIQRPGQVLDHALLIVKDGKIAAVGTDLVKPDGARELDAKVLCAAFVDPWGALGLSPAALGDRGACASTRATDAYDAYSNKELREQTLRAGVTCVCVQSGATARVGGVSAVVRVAPDLPEERRIVAREAALGMSCGLSANAPGPQQSFEIVDGQVVQRETGSRRMDPFDRLADVERVTAAIESGRNYRIAKNEYRHELEEWQKKTTEKEVELEKDAKKAKKDHDKEEKDAKEKGKKFEEKKYKEDKKPQSPKFDEDSEVLARVADGELPLVVQAHRTAELRALLSGTEKQDRLRLVVAGGTESLGLASQFVARHVPVLLAPLPVGRGAADELDGVDLSLPARLARAGVVVLIGSGGVDPAGSRDLPLLAELAIGNGLDGERALDAITLGAAHAFDVDARIGSVEQGKDAELLLLDGDPLTTEGRVRYVISAGRIVVAPEG